MQSIEKVEIEEIKRNSLMENGKLILDACCGSRMFWFDKKNPLALFADIRDEEYILCDGRNLKGPPRHRIGLYRYAVFG